MPKRAVHGAEPSKHPQPQPRLTGAVMWLLLALTGVAVALAGVAIALSTFPAAAGATLALTALAVLCFGAAMWLRGRR